MCGNNLCNCSFMFLGVSGVDGLPSQIRQWTGFLGFLGLHLLLVEGWRAVHARRTTANYLFIYMSINPKLEPFKIENLRRYPTCCNGLKDTDRATRIGLSMVEKSWKCQRIFQGRIFHSRDDSSYIRTITALFLNENNAGVMNKCVFAWKPRELRCVATRKTTSSGKWRRYTA